MQKAQQTNTDGSTTGRSGRILAGQDLVLIVGTMMALKILLLQIDLLWTYAGPISLVTSLAVATWCLKRSGESWTSLGLNGNWSFRKILFWSFVLLAVTMVAGIVVNSGIAAAMGDRSLEADPRYSGRFVDLPGNIAFYLYWIAISWAVGAFAEEMLFRAMLISRIERLFAGSSFGLMLAVVTQAALFGQQHYYYQGLSGAMATGVIALISGAFYIGLKRNLWSLILSHGAANMIGLTLVFIGAQPAT